MLHKSSSNPLTSFRENIFFPLYENVASRMKVLEEKTKAYGKNQIKAAIFEIHGSHASLTDWKTPMGLGFLIAPNVAMTTYNVLTDIDTARR